MNFLIRLTQVAIAAALMFMAFGVAMAPAYLACGAFYLCYDAVTARSLRGKIIDGAAGLGLLFVFFFGSFPLAGILFGYASLSVLSDALASTSLRARYHTA